MAQRARLFGFSTLFSLERRIQLTNTVMIYDFGDRAGFVIGSMDQNSETTQDVHINHPVWRHGMRLLIGVLHEIAGYPYVDPQVEERERRMRQFKCERCHGTGQVEDYDENWMPCPDCQY